MVRSYPACHEERRERHPFFNLRSGAASARHFLSSLCRCGSLDPLFVPARCLPCKPDSALLSPLGNLQTFKPFTFQTILRSIPFRITFFAHPHPLNLIESYSYKKQGGGGGAPRHLAPTKRFAPARSATTPATPIFSSIYFTTLWIPRGGASVFPCPAARTSALLRYPFPRFASPPCLMLGGPNES
jgi:hypothetical protein